VVVVRTKRQTDFEAKLKKKVRTSGCAQGTVFGDLMERFDQVRLPADGVLADFLALRPGPPGEHHPRRST
jgi:FdhD protein